MFSCMYTCTVNNIVKFGGKTKLDQMWIVSRVDKKCP